jgi:hypothetical protein
MVAIAAALLTLEVFRLPTQISIRTEGQTYFVYAPITVLIFQSTIRKFTTYRLMIKGLQSSLIIAVMWNYPQTIWNIVE